VIPLKKSKPISFPYPNQKFIKTEQFLKLDFSYYMVNRMVKDNLIKKINGTTYENLNYTGDESDYLYVSGYIDEGVVCLMSAAVYHNISTFRMSQVDVAIQQKSKVAILPDWPSIDIYYFSHQRYTLGILTNTIDGGSFKIYDMEKTVCDLLSYRNKYGLEDSLSVLKNYLKREDRNIDKLISYSKKLRCYHVLIKYLEVLL
jgi:predicted transcriptional regulator of viral defense system